MKASEEATGIVVDVFLNQCKEAWYGPCVARIQKARIVFAKEKWMHVAIATNCEIRNAERFSRARLTAHMDTESALDVFAWDHGSMIEIYALEGDEENITHVFSGQTGDVTISRGKDKNHCRVGATLTSG